MPRAVITGGAGFVGSHVCGRFLDEGWGVVCLDSLLTGAVGNLSSAMDRSGFEFRQVDVSERVSVAGPVDAVLHLASPASPVDYLQHPIETLRAGALGAHITLEMARYHEAAFVLASTSEVYGDPKVHPQPESYWGNVNPVGPRSVYDEAKRYAEAVTMAFHRRHAMPVKIARIFNTYGPRMRRHDGRAVPTFIDQARRGDPLTVHGDGQQTRSLCYVDDMVEGLWRLLHSEHVGPVNLGNPEELTILDLAERIRSLVGSNSEIRFDDRPEDDPQVRCPDISLAQEMLAWQPKVSLEVGLRDTVAWTQTVWATE